VTGSSTSIDESAKPVSYGMNHSFEEAMNEEITHNVEISRNDSPPVIVHPKVRLRLITDGCFTKQLLLTTPFSTNAVELPKVEVKSRIV
jgi:hypothetical protein